MNCKCECCLTGGWLENELDTIVIDKKYEADICRVCYHGLMRNRGELEKFRNRLKEQEKVKDAK